MSDLISRQAAIEAIEEVDWYHQNKNNDMVSGANSSEHQAWYKAEDVYQALEQLPSVQLETCSYWDRESNFCALHRPFAQSDREKGEWLDNETSYSDDAPQTCTCSVCGIRSRRPIGDFCKWCGADMRGTDETNG